MSENMQKAKKRGLVIKEVDTGDIWLCPICKRKYHLIHRERSDGKILKHDFEEASEK